MIGFKSRRAASRVLGTLLVMCLAFAAGCGGDDDGNGNGNGNGDGASASGEVQEVELLLSFRESFSWTPLLVARDQGYFREEEIEIATQETEGCGFVTQQIIAGNSDFGWAGADSDVIAFATEPDLRR